eukprot:scaffold14473_cov40-Prasinocladus_malaysianus.AAC.1
MFQGLTHRRPDDNARLLRYLHCVLDIVDLHGLHICGFGIFLGVLGRLLVSLTAVGLILGIPFGWRWGAAAAGGAALAAVEA